MPEDFSQKLGVRPTSPVTTPALPEEKKEIHSKGISSFGHIFSLKSLRKDIDDLRESSSLGRQIKLCVKIYAKVISAPLVFTAKALIKASTLTLKGIKKVTENTQKKFSDVNNQKNTARSPASEPGKPPMTMLQILQRERRKAAVQELDAAAAEIGTWSKIQTKNVNQKPSIGSHTAQDTKSEKKQESASKDADILKQLAESKGKEDIDKILSSGTEKNDTDSVLSPNPSQTPKNTNNVDKEATEKNSAVSDPIEDLLAEIDIMIDKSKKDT